MKHPAISGLVDDYNNYRSQGMSETDAVELVLDRFTRIGDAIKLKKPCPFCGGNNLTLDLNAPMIDCDDCPCTLMDDSRSIERLCLIWDSERHL